MRRAGRGGARGARRPAVGRAPEHGAELPSMERRTSGTTSPTGSGRYAGVPGRADSCGTALAAAASAATQTVRKTIVRRWPERQLLRQFSSRIPQFEALFRLRKVLRLLLNSQFPDRTFSPEIWPELIRNSSGSFSRAEAAGCELGVAGGARRNCSLPPYPCDPRQGRSAAPQPLIGRQTIGLREPTVAPLPRA